MAEQSFFQEALSNFTNEIAYGDAVKRLADEGFSVKQILEKIDYPAPESKVEKMVFERLCDTGVIMLELPDKNLMLSAPKSAGFNNSQQKIKKDKMLKLINNKCEQNGQENSYILLEFDLENKDTTTMLSALDKRQQQYIMGIFKNNKKLYHRLNFTIREILYSLYGMDGFSAECCFLKSKEILFI